MSDTSTLDLVSKAAFDTWGLACAVRIRKGMPMGVGLVQQTIAEAFVGKRVMAHGQGASAQDALEDLLQKIQ